MMRRKMQHAVVLVALLAPTFAALCQWQCHFMSDPESPLALKAATPAAARMECCANQQSVLRKLIPELGSKTTLAKLLEAPPRMSAEVFDSPFITHESPPGAGFFFTPLSSSSILRI